MKIVNLIDLVIGATGMVLDSTIKNFKTLFKENSTNALQLSQKAAIMGNLKYSSHFVDLNSTTATTTSTTTSAASSNIMQETIP